MPRPPKRQLARPGLSYVDANHGRIVTVENDVFDMKRQIEERWPELEVWMDKDGGPNGEPTFVIIEHCSDGVDRLGVERPYLDQRLFDDLEKADGARKGNDDPYTLMERYNDMVQAAKDKEFADKIGDVGERLAFAFAQDGLTSRPRVAIPNKPESMCL